MFKRHRNWEHPNEQKPNWGMIILVALVTIVALIDLLASRAKAQDVAIGDSIALGVGTALHVPTYAKSGMSSCWVLRHMPNASFKHAVISAGINDAPGSCIDAIFNKIRANQVVVILPAGINSARAHVAQEAQSHGFPTISYTCHGGCNRGNFHPGSYAQVANSVQSIWRTKQ